MLNKNKKEIESRSSFLKKILFICGGIFSTGFFGNEILKAKKQLEESQLNNNTGIIAINPLGFNWRIKDPFLYCVYHVDLFPKGNSSLAPNASLEGRNIGSDFEPKDGWRMYHGTKIPGFPNHPHRGFETITIVEKGYIDHFDSLGSTGRYGTGDVQWMTAGKGIQHAEMFPLLNKEQDNTMEVFQIWLNLPAKKKLVQPYYKMLWSEKITNVSFTDEMARTTKVKVIAGNLKDQGVISPPPNSWAFDIENHVAIWIIEMESKAIWTIPRSIPGLNRMLYFYFGEKIKINEIEVNVNNGLELISDSELKIENGESKSKLLLLQGRPVGETVIQYGPFVMNTKQEINEAYSDYLQTEFGGWPWNSAEPIHNKEKGRFARYPDGTEEKA